MVFYPKKKKKNFLVELSINLKNLFRSGISVQWPVAKSFVQDIDSLTSIRLVGNKYKIPNLVAENREKNNTKQLHDTKNYVI